MLAQAATTAESAARLCFPMLAQAATTAESAQCLPLPVLAYFVRHADGCRIKGRAEKGLSSFLECRAKSQVSERVLKP